MHWFTRQRAIYVALGLILAIIGWRYSSSSSPTSTSADVSSSVEVRTYAAPPAPPATPVVVHVVGRVAHPGVYRLPGGSRVKAALHAAGGPRSGADLQAINLAAPAIDGQQIVVPRRGEAPAPVGASPTSPGKDAPLSLSQATAEQLEALDGIGPTLAARIVAWRENHGPFVTVEQLGDVPGIGDARLAALRDAVVP